MTTLRVGGEVDALCTRCKLTLAHTILAMVGSKIARVRCNTCGGDHAFRSSPSGERSSGGTRAAPREREAKVVIGFEAQLASKDVGQAKDYSPKTAFALDEVVRHPSFGLGIVTAVRGDKVDVAFRAATKTLVHARGDVAAARPTFQPPGRPTEGPADKPQAQDEPS